MGRIDFIIMCLYIPVSKTKDRHLPLEIKCVAMFPIRKKRLLRLLPFLLKSVAGEPEVVRRDWTVKC